MRHRLISLSAILPALFVLLASPAFAHHLPPGLEEVDEFADSVSFLMGFNHSLTGLDHLIAALLTGVVAARLGKTGRVALPLGSAALLLAGFAAGSASFAMPGSEGVILMSIIFGGVVAVIKSKCAVQRGAWVLAAFQAWHGNIHSLEAAPGAAGIPYAAGLTAATLVLAVIGFALTRLARRWMPVASEEAQAA